MRLKLIILFAAGFMLICSTMTAEAHAEDDFFVRASVDRKSIFIGDKIKYSIETRSKGNFEVKGLAFKDEMIGEFEINGYKNVAKRTLFGERRILYIYWITTYSVGAHTIPAVDIRYRRKGAAEWAGKTTNEVNIVVESGLGKWENVDDIKDIKGPIPFPEFNWLIPSGVLALVLLFFIILSIIKRRKSQAPPKLPHEAALEELELLLESFNKSGNVKDYYIKVSDCVRYYIERRFNLRAPEMTTEEFLNSLRDSDGLAGEDKRLLGMFLASCDLVKFAKYAPTKEEIDSIKMN